MQLMKPASKQSWLILDKVFRFPGTADSLMQKTPQERMETLANYLAVHITVWKYFFEKSFFGNFDKFAVNLKLSWNCKIFQSVNNRLPAGITRLRPDCSTINLAETSDQPENWLLHPTGITFKFDAKLKTLKRNNPIADANPAEIKKF